MCLTGGGGIVCSPLTFRFFPRFAFSRLRFRANPSLSAIQSEPQRNQAALLQESLKIAAILQVLPSKRTGESVTSTPAGKLSGVFLWRAHAQSGFGDSIRRMHIRLGLEQRTGGV